MYIVPLRLFLQHAFTLNSSAKMFTKAEDRSQCEDCPTSINSFRAKYVLGRRVKKRRHKLAASRASGYPHRSRTVAASDTANLKAEEEKGLVNSLPRARFNQNGE